MYIKTKKTTRPSFYDVAIPTGWNECTDKQKRIIFFILSIKKGAPAKVSIFLKLTRISILKEDDLGYLCSRRGTRFYIASWEMMSFIQKLSWLDTPGSYPSPLSVMHGRKAINERLYTVDFETYLELESFYQMYMESIPNKSLERKNKALMGMFNILYPQTRFWHKWRKSLPLDTELAIITWMAQVKGLLSNYFKDFFQPAENMADNSGHVNVLELCNAQIRALTAGDITKEDDALKKKCWRALTELNAKAKEAKELKKLQNDNK